MNKEKLISKIFSILSLVFAILTLVGGYLVITHKLDNAGYSVIPMLFTLIFSTLYKNSKKIKSNINYNLLVRLVWNITSLFIKKIYLVSRLENISIYGA